MPSFCTTADQGQMWAFSARYAKSLTYKRLCILLFFGRLFTL